MNEQVFKFLCVGFALLFSICFVVLIIPPFLANPDIVAAFAAGFVNPFTSAYAFDAIVCGLILFTWVIYEAKNFGIKHGWICLVLSIVPGVAVGLGLYLVLRQTQIKKLMK